MPNKNEVDEDPESTPSWNGVPMEKIGPDLSKVPSKRLRELLKPDEGSRDNVIDRDRFKPTNPKL